MLGYFWSRFDKDHMNLSFHGNQKGSIVAISLQKTFY